MNAHQQRILECKAKESSKISAEYECCLVVNAELGQCQEVGRAQGWRQLSISHTSVAIIKGSGKGSGAVCACPRSGILSAKSNVPLPDNTPSFCRASLQKECKSARIPLLLFTSI